MRILWGEGSCKRFVICVREKVVRGNSAIAPNEFFCKDCSVLFVLFDTDIIVWKVTIVYFHESVTASPTRPPQLQTTTYILSSGTLHTRIRTHLFKFTIISFEEHHRLQHLKSTEISHFHNSRTFTKTSFIMEAATMIDVIASNASKHVKQHYRALWKMFLSSIEESAPHMLIPRSLADQVGEKTLIDIMNRFR